MEIQWPLSVKLLNPCQLVKYIRSLASWANFVSVKKVQWAEVFSDFSQWKFPLNDS